MLQPQILSRSTRCSLGRTHAAVVPFRSAAAPRISVEQSAMLACRHHTPPCASEPRFSPSFACRSSQQDERQTGTAGSGDAEQDLEPHADAAPDAAHGSAQNVAQLSADSGEPADDAAHAGEGPADDQHAPLRLHAEESNNEEPDNKVSVEEKPRERKKEELLADLRRKRGRIDASTKAISESADQLEQLKNNMPGLPPLQDRVLGALIGCAPLLTSGHGDASHSGNILSALFREVPSWDVHVSRPGAVLNRMWFRN